LIGELEAVRRRDDDDAVVRADDLALDELAERGERDAGVRAVEHAGPIGARRLVGKLLLARLLDDAIEALQGANRALDAHRVADLDRARERLLRRHRLERLEMFQK